MFKPSLKIAPPPKKPIPVITPAAIRVGSPPVTPGSCVMNTESIDISAEDTLIKISVRNPTVC